MWKVRGAETGRGSHHDTSYGKVVLCPTYCRRTRVWYPSRLDSGQQSAHFKVVDFSGDSY